jgi:hypothetical protein
MGEALIITVVVLGQLGFYGWLGWVGTRGRRAARRAIPATAADGRALLALLGVEPTGALTPLREAWIAGQRAGAPLSLARGESPRWSYTEGKAGGYNQLIVNELRVGRSPGLRPFAPVVVASPFRDWNHVQTPSPNVGLTPIGPLAGAAKLNHLPYEVAAGSPAAIRRNATHSDYTFDSRLFSGAAEAVGEVRRQRLDQELGELSGSAGWLLAVEADAIWFRAPVGTSNESLAEIVRRLDALAAALGDPAGAVYFNHWTDSTAPVASRETAYRTWAAMTPDTSVADAATVSRPGVDALARVFAAHACGRAGVETLAAWAADGTAPAVAAAYAAQLLDELAPARFRDHVLELASTSPVPLWALEYIAKNRFAAGAGVARNGLATRDPQRQRTAIAALAAIGDATAEPAVRELLESDDRSVFEAAVDYLATCGTVHSLQLLRDATKRNRGIFGDWDLESATNRAIARIEARTAPAEAGRLSVVDDDRDGGELSVVDGDGAPKTATEAFRIS